MQAIARFPIAALLAFSATAACAPALHADCNWPPLNPIVQRQSNPVTVGSVTFTTGYYSWHVPHYHIGALHCSSSIDSGPRSWSAIVGLGGNEPIGPRVASTETSSESVRQSPLAQLPSIPSLDSTPRVLPSLPPLAPPANNTANLEGLPPLAALPSLAP